MITLVKIMNKNFEGLNENEVMLGENIRDTFTMEFNLLDAQISEQKTVNFLLGLEAPTALISKVKRNLSRTLKLMEDFQNGCKSYKDFYARVLSSGNATDEMDSILKSSLEVSDEVVSFLESKYN